MKFEKISQPNIADKFFAGDRERFKNRVKEIMETSEFKTGTPGFINQVLDDYTNKSPEELARYKKEINAAISEIKEEEDSKKQRQKEKMMRGAELAARQESRRTGIHPEDFNKL